MANELQIQNLASNKTRDLILSIIIDLIGMSTFMVPVFGEIGDIIWAPISGYLMTRIYKGVSGKAAGIFAFLEEVLPFTDVIPTFTLMWIYTYKIKRQPKGKGAH